jgi:hypothetical protein
LPVEANRLNDRRRTTARIRRTIRIPFRGTIVFIETCFRFKK